ncbi:squalene/phytoene synthase family protein [Streptomyces sp. Qhu-G9]|uniref:squalene/phytoene synthase family protein n=1 Tax=Streptomyces sp. Qhu-G9 TaxID=3452799 RepID=UPI0022AC365A|nr:squalene/phytoene synthase family protein [Streptomyces aurantiacus]WAU83639.1 squalene/phytoene synthase family protein [Streptomyces aurantiacus]
MRTWRRSLEAAEVRQGVLRDDYTKVARFMWRREPAGYLAVRLMVPVAHQPHALAGYAFAAFTDDICDRGTVLERTRRYDAWDAQVRTALDSGSAGHPLLRAFLHTAATRELPRRWVDSYLDGARIDLDFAGFATEADYQRYVEQLTWPFLMITSGLAHQGGGSAEFAAACRLFADAAQRTDILTDLSEDLRGGRLYLPVSDLDRYGIARADLEQGRDLPGVRALIAATAQTARATLREAGVLLEHCPAEHRRLMRFVLDLHHQRLESVAARGASVARRPVRDRPVACLRLLARRSTGGHRDEFTGAPGSASVR